MRWSSALALVGGCSFAGVRAPDPPSVKGPIECHEGLVVADVAFGFLGTSVALAAAGVPDSIGLMTFFVVLPAASVAAIATASGIYGHVTARRCRAVERNAVATAAPDVAPVLEATPQQLELRQRCTDEREAEYRAAIQSTDLVQRRSTLNALQSCERPEDEPVAPRVEPRREDDRGYIAAGVIVSREDGGPANTKRGLSLEAALRPDTWPFWLHARAAAGTDTVANGSDNGGVTTEEGMWQRITGGIEYRSCGVRACGFIGIDAGYMHRASMSYGSVEGPIAGPRVGFELGSDRVFLRAGLDVFASWGRSFDRPTTAPPSPYNLAALTTGAAISTSVLYRFGPSLRPPPAPPQPTGVAPVTESELLEERSWETLRDASLAATDADCTRMVGILAHLPPAFAARLRTDPLVAACLGGP